MDLAQRRPQPACRILPGPGIPGADRSELLSFWAVAGKATYGSVQTAPLVIVPMSSKRIYLEQCAQQDSRCPAGPLAEMIH